MLEEALGGQVPSKPKPLLSLPFWLCLYNNTNANMISNNYNKIGNQYLTNICYLIGTVDTIVNKTSTVLRNVQCSEGKGVNR